MKELKGIQQNIYDMIITYVNRAFTSSDEQETLIDMIDVLVSSIQGGEDDAK